MTSATRTRDLASQDIWERSLERSRRRRVLAEDARKTISRRKNASLAVTAAMATTPVIPSVLSSAIGGASKKAENHRTVRPDSGDRILLKRGAVSPSVAEVQQRLNVADDGYYGPVTEKAVRKFQKRSHLAVTGMVNVKTWLKLFPHGMVIYSPHSGLAQMSSQAPAADLQAAQAAHAGGDMGTSKKAQKRAAKLKAAGGAPHDANADHGILPDPVHSGGGSTGGAAAGDFVPSAPSGGGGGGSSTGGGGGGGGGPTIVPHGPFTSASEMIAAMIAAANRIDSHHYAYRWGGGHANFSGPYDCSGAVSAVLHAAGLLNRPMVSGEFAHWGRPGRGAVTLYANAGHVYMSILGRYFGTSYANPGGGAGWFRGGPRPGFVVVHVPFESFHFKNAKAASHKAKVRKATRRTQTTSSQYQSVTPGYSGQAPGAAEAQSSGSAGTASSGGQDSYSGGTSPSSGTEAASNGSTGSAGTTAASDSGSSGTASPGTASSGGGYSGGSSSAGTSSASSGSSGGGYDGSASTGSSGSSSYSSGSEGNAASSSGSSSGSSESSGSSGASSSGSSGYDSSQSSGSGSGSSSGSSGSASSGSAASAGSGSSGSSSSGSGSAGAPSGQSESGNGSGESGSSGSSAGSSG